MHLHSHAKINWSLRVLGRRADGFHDLETLLQEISLHDTLVMERSDRIEVRCDDPTIPTDERNLAFRAALAMQMRRKAPPVSIAIAKRIPAGGGLGGGSSNAGATLLAIDRMFELHTPPQELHEIALALGSDVPFFLGGGTAYATGRGEILTALPPLSSIPLLLLIPEERVDTAEAFALLAATRRAPSAPLGLEHYRKKTGPDFLSHAEDLMNDFEPPIFARLPRLVELKRRLVDAGAAWAALTGSGSTIVGAFRSPEQRDEAFARFIDCRAVRAETVASGQ
jgi:4-diphosphocytidyl-2-C-methyl-D-erythritol kinase